MQNDIELLKKLPQEHWTEHKGKTIQIKDLIELITKELKNEIRHEK